MIAQRNFSSKDASDAKTRVVLRRLGKVRQMLAALTTLGRPGSPDLIAKLKEEERNLAAELGAVTRDDLNNPRAQRQMSIS